MLLDLRLPDLNGESVLEFLASKSHLREVPVILLTGDVTAMPADLALRYPVLDRVSKPFSPAELRSKIEKALAISRAEVKGSRIMST